MGPTRGNGLRSSFAPFSALELDYLGLISDAMQNPVSVEGVRYWLTEAQAKGLDPAKIYEARCSAAPRSGCPLRLSAR